MKLTHKLTELTNVDAVVASASSLAAAAAALGVNRSTLHRWIIAGKVRPPARARRRARGRKAVAVRLQTLLERFEAALDRLERAVQPRSDEAV